MMRLKKFRNMSEYSRLKIMLGGVPLGCDNIGDEATLASAVGIFRRLMPECELTVCTAKQRETASKFNCNTLPLYGFDRSPLSEFRRVVANYDLFIWFGATGLSDYPETACALLENSQKAGVATVVWNVGMNNVFNPMLYSLAGKKLKLCKLLESVTWVDWAAHFEKFIHKRVRKRLADTLGKSRLIVLRDEASLLELRKCASFPQAMVGADSAILQKSVEFESLRWEDHCAQMFNSATKRVALCLSSQSPVGELDDFAAWLDNLNLSENVLTIMLPMNPITDYEFMEKLRSKMKYSQKTIMPRFIEPEEIQCVVAKCNLVISSRLHLMILALNHLIPCIGIARGSKINSFLDQFGLPVAGSTGTVDFNTLDYYAKKYLGANDFSLQGAKVRKKMVKNLSEAESRLKSVLYEINSRI